MCKGRKILVLHSKPVFKQTKQKIEKSSNLNSSYIRTDQVEVDAVKLNKEMYSTMVEKGADIENKQFIELNKE